jgi:hypothetical protein
MSKKTDAEIAAIMARFDAEMQSKQPGRRGGRTQLAPYAEQFRRYIEMGWTRKEILAELKAHGLSTSVATLRDVLGIHEETKAVRKPRVQTVGAQR